ncbi:MAG: hypothetical protein DRJ65_22055 [Acidobacteria bacterium]|nr:MAG: hypothetical protein DRJ65_22055 [Acidobacteriota bacterium]
MKRLLTVLAVAFVAGACVTTDYMGKTYPPTSHADVFFKAEDVKHAYETMGRIEGETTEYMTFEVIEQQLIKEAMAKGADAILILGMDTKVVGSTSATSGKGWEDPKYVIDEDGDLKNVGGDGHYSAFSTSTDIRDKVVTAELLKYTD